MNSKIDRRERLSYNDFAAEYLYRNRPVIVVGALSGWRALSRWTPEFFKSEYGDMRFSITDSEYGQSKYPQSKPAEFTMSAYIDHVLASTEGNPAPYFRNKVLYDLFPELKEDIQPLPEYLLPNWLGDRYMVDQVGRVLNRGNAIEIYIGGTGGAFPVLHYDGAGTHAFLMQIYGRKQYIVYPPDQEKFLYPSAEKPNISLVNSVDKPDLAKFPLFSQATPTIFNLEPGELLFVPSHWWHTAKILTPSITISANVLNQSNWHELEKYVATKRQNVFTSAAARVYLSAAGMKRSWRDRAWRRRVRLAA